MTTELAPAKLNLVLWVGPPRPDGMHPICSLFGSLELADEVTFAEAERDEVVCPGVEGDNLATAALAAFRAAVPDALAPQRVTIAKAIPVAAGLGGGSADAAAVLRVANRLTGEPLDADALRGIAAGLGSDVPSQVEPGPALVTGVGERVEPIDLPDAALVLVPAVEGLRSGDVFAELDRLEGWREPLEPEALSELAAHPLEALAPALENDLEEAALSLRPELERTLEDLVAAGALGAAITGSGPTAFGLFGTEGDAEDAASRFDGALVTRLRGPA